MEGVSPPGPWIYEVQGEKDGAYDLAISSPYDQDGETDGFDFNSAELVQSAGEPGTYIPTSDVFLAPAGDVSQQLLQVQTGYQLLPDSGIALNFNVGEL